MGLVLSGGVWNGLTHPLVWGVLIPGHLHLLQWRESSKTVNEKEGEGRRRRGERAVPTSEGRGTSPGLNRSGDHPPFETTWNEQKCYRIIMTLIMSVITGEIVHPPNPWFLAFRVAEAKYVSGQFKLNLGVQSWSEERQALTVCKFSSDRWLISLRKRAVQWWEPAGQGVSVSLSGHLEKWAN